MLLDSKFASRAVGAMASEHLSRREEEVSFLEVHHQRSLKAAPGTKRCSACLALYRSFLLRALCLPRLCSWALNFEARWVYTRPDSDGHNQPHQISGSSHMLYMCSST